jgi:hypothetical protein
MKLSVLGKPFELQTLLFVHLVFNIVLCNNEKGVMR